MGFYFQQFKWNWGSKLYDLKIIKSGFALLCSGNAIWWIVLFLFVVCHFLPCLLKFSSSSFPNQQFIYFFLNEKCNLFYYFLHHYTFLQYCFLISLRFTEQECDEMFNGAPVDPKGRFNYVEFTRIIKHGSKEE